MCLAHSIWLCDPYKHEPRARSTLINIQAKKQKFNNSCRGFYIIIILYIHKLPLIQDVFQLVVEVTSEEDSESTKRVVITFPKTLSVTDSPSTVDVYKSDSISLSLRYKITSNCEAGMYGESCEHQCVLPRQQVTAGCKYSCNYLGDVVCVNEQPQVELEEVNKGIQFNVVVY